MCLLCSESGADDRNSERYEKEKDYERIAERKEKRDKEGQKDGYFVVTAVRTSNLAQKIRRKWLEVNCREKYQDARKFRNKRGKVVACA